MAEADDPNDVPAEVWLAYERQAKDVMNLWAPDVPALQTAVHAAMIRAWRSGRAVAAEPVAVKPLEWSEASPPNEYCRYSHTFADTPFGRYQIEWKGWKDHPSFTVELAGEHQPIYGATLEHTREMVQADYEARIRSALALPA